MLGLTSKIAEDSLNFIHDDKINPNSPAYKELQDLMEDHKYLQQRMKNIESSYKAGDIYRNEQQYLAAKNKVQESINAVVYRMQQVTGDAKSITVKGYKYDADPKATDLKPKTNLGDANIVLADSRWGQLSNLADHTFTYEGREYRSVEHAYQANKSGKFDEPTYRAYFDRPEARKINTGPAANKKTNIKLMEDLYRQMLSENPDMVELLKETEGFNITHQLKKTDIWTTEMPKILTKLRDEFATGTPELKTVGWIDELADNEIFVFGSNQEGIHGKGAALDAKNKFGAVQGVGEGLTGQTYALPTKSTPNKSLTIDEVSKNLDTFLEVAKNNPNKIFKMSAIGTNLAGFEAQEIADLLFSKDIPSNVHVPESLFKLKGNTPEVKRPLPDNVVESTEDFRKMFNRYGPGGMPPMDTPEFATWYEKEIEGKSSTEIIDDIAKNADVESSLLRKAMGEVPGFLVVPLEAAVEVGLRYGRLGKSFPNVAKNARRFIMYELAMFAAAVVTGVVTYGANKFRATTGFDSRDIYTPYSYKGTDEANQRMEEAVAYSAEVQKIYEEYPELKEYNEQAAHEFAMEQATENMDFFIKKMPTYYIDEILFEYVPELREAREEYADKKFFSEGGWRADLAQPQLYEIVVGGIINAMIEGGKRMNTSYGR